MSNGKPKDCKHAPDGGNEPSGHVRFDDRGNAVWETWRGRRLEHPGLELANDVTPPVNGLVENKKGLLVGYDPYESGMLHKPGHRKKKNLRELSKWIELKKNFGNEPED